MNPHQLSLAKQCIFKIWKRMPESAKTSWSQKRWCNKPTKWQVQSLSIRKILMLSKRYESTEVDRRTWKDVFNSFEDIFNSFEVIFKYLKISNRGRLLLRPSGHVPNGICQCSFVETTDTQSYITPVYDTFPRLDFLPTLTLLLNIGLHRASATGVACRQGTLSPPDTWSCPTLGRACVVMSRPISPELVLSPDFWISNISRYFSFASNNWIYVRTAFHTLARFIYSEDCQDRHCLYLQVWDWILTPLIFESWVL